MMLAVQLAKERALALHALERLPKAVQNESLRLERETLLTLKRATQRAIRTRF